MEIGLYVEPLNAMRSQICRQLNRQEKGGKAVYCCNVNVPGCRLRTRGDCLRDSIKYKSWKSRIGDGIISSLYQCTGRHSQARERYLPGLLIDIMS